jgi:hypothetical protein
MMPDQALTFASVLPTLLVAHNFADHWAQSSHQACHKGGARGDRVAILSCAGHVITYTAITTVATVGVALVLHLPVTVLGVFLGQIVSAVTHYWADRRWTLRALALRLGKAQMAALGVPRQVRAVDADGKPVRLVDEHGHEVSWDNPSLGTGSYALDQSWHWIWLLVAALLTALVQN